MIRIDELEAQPADSNRDAYVVFLDGKRVGRLLKRNDGNTFSYSAMIYRGGGIGAMTHGYRSKFEALHWIAEVLMEQMYEEDEDM